MPSLVMPSLVSDNTTMTRLRQGGLRNCGQWPGLASQASAQPGLAALLTNWPDHGVAPTPAEGSDGRGAEGTLRRSRVRGRS
jgi:hypothetical protein